MQINGRAICFLLSFLLPMLCSAGAAKTLYVDDDAAGANDGTSWANAYTFLQEALADARLAEKPVEIRVAQGIYRPNGGLMAIPEFDWRTTTFQLINGVTLKGGYAGLGEPDPDARDIDLYETILSGDLNDDDVNVNEPEDLLNEPTRAENSYHVVTGSGTDETAVLDGFIISGGNADRLSYDQGGGMHSTSGSPTVAACTFSGNSAAFGGGGMYNENSSPTLVDCSFVGNWGWNGGGMTNYYISDTTLINCRFSRNSAVGGAGMYISGGSQELINCIFSGNSADSVGGGISKKWDGLTLANCTFTGNSAESGNALSTDSPCSVKLFNCILWDGGDEIRDEKGSNVNIFYSNIQGGWEGEGNIDVDPVFADPDNDDYHLKSEAGRWDPLTESWIVDDVTSPCIDAGEPNSPVAFEPFPNGGVINMGAFGGTAKASKSPSGLHAKYGGGTGEPNTPYLIYTPEQMNTVGLHAEDRDSHFRLMADIDLSRLGTRDFNVIGTFPNFFRGVFDGNGHTISNFTYISTDVDGVALFSNIDGKQAEIRDVGLIDPVVDVGMVNPNLNDGKGNTAGSLVNYLWSGAVSRCYVQGGSISGDISVGGLVAYNKAGTITDCCSTADVAGGGNVGGILGYNEGTIAGCHAMSTIIGERDVGGLVGYNRGTIRDSSASGNVTGDFNVGGLVGYSDRYGIIQSSYSTGHVTGVQQVGGLVGRCRGDLINCYSNGSVSGGRYVGGLVGLLSGLIMDCYSTGNIAHEPIEGFEGNPRISGLVGTGYDPNDVLMSFWDIETSGRTISFGGTGKSTAEMQTAGTFLEAGWDFINETEKGTDDIWWILEGQDYPRLWWELASEN